MKTIHLPKVYEVLGSRSAGRVIGWFRSHDDALEGLHNFGCECRWSYAVIEEMGPGMHGQTVNATWFKFDDELNDWVSLDKDCTNSFMQCINHTIG